MPRKSIKKYLNKVILGDVLELLPKIRDKSVDMVFGDPDYNVGVLYGDKKYTKRFDDYIEWYIEIAKESFRILKDDGNMFFINYPKQNAHLRVNYLDNVCSDVFDYSWIYNTNVGHSKKKFTTAHRSVLHCIKSKKNKFYKDQVAQPYKNPNDKRIMKLIAQGSKGRMPYDWFEFNLVKNVSKEKTIHVCQIPQKLSEMLIKSCTKENDIVFVLFGGSGAELEVCKKITRQYISAEIDEIYYDIIRERLKQSYL